MKRQTKRGQWSRRSFVTAAGAALATPFLSRRGIAQGANQLVITSWGGSYQAAMEEFVVKPFMAETGINVSIVQASEIARLKAQIDIGKIEWDVVDGNPQMSMGGRKAGYWQPIDYNVVDKTNLVGGIYPDTVGFYMAVGGIAWNSRNHPGDNVPKTFKDMFDLTQFPGTRTFRSKPSETLEMALLADGVERAKLYPLDVDRAFKVMNRVKAKIPKWATTTNETVSLIQNGEVDYSYSYTNRVRAAVNGGAPLRFSFDQTIGALEYLQVVKGCNNPQGAMKYIAFATRPDVLGRFCNATSLVPNNKKSAEFISEDSRKWMPDLTSSKVTVVNDVWWSDNAEEVEKRFKLWMIS